MRQIFLDFAGEEQGHKRKLLRIKQDGSLLSTAEKVTDLKMADYLTDVEPSSDLEYEEALILAMKKEKAAFKLYTDLAATTDNETLRATLLGLAQEEAKHKLRFEIEYDDLMTEN